MEVNIDSAVSIIKKGGIVIYPTDTAFGIGCSIDNKQAVERLFSIKKRDKNQAVPILVDSMQMVKEYSIEVTKDIQHIMQTYWPGGLTIILPCNIYHVTSLVRGNGNTIAVRMPNHITALSIIKKIGVPIIGTSANFHGQKTPFKKEEIDDRLISLVDFVLPGICTVAKVSTIIDCSVYPWKIRREGAVKVKL
jgi:L-threonylcarbamoyladenylate synthase